MLVFYHDELTEEDIKILSLVSEITKNDVVKIGWHIFLKDIMDYAAIRRES